MTDKEVLEWLEKNCKLLVPTSSKYGWVVFTDNTLAGGEGETIKEAVECCISRLQLLSSD